MKKRGLVLSIVLGIFAFLSAFTFVGCNTSLDDLKASFDKLEKTYQTYSSIFVNGSLAGTIYTHYVVNYGDDVNNYVENNRENYRELRDEYNVMLAISNDYIDTNKGYILNYDFKTLSGEAKKSLGKLNRSLKAYTKEIESFVESRKTMTLFFEQFGEGDRDSTAEDYQIRIFKRAYGKLVSKNIELSTNLAKSIELTEIFDLIKKTETTSSDVSIIKDYIQTKMLPIYNEFLINSISNEVNWNVYAGKNERLDNLVAAVKDSFNLYKTQLVNGSTSYKNISSEQMTALFDKIDNFLIEEDVYEKALKEFDIATFVKAYDSDLTRYEKKNSLASLYLDKMEQFIQKTVPNFIGEIKEYLFN